ncbi:MAG: 2-oxoacid:acceptor oxidoreductase subunit alpha, partial [Verrucomicrobiota bacterium]
TLDQETRPEDFKPYPLDGPTRHAPPGAAMAGGKYPVVTGLEHDEWGHPTASPELHQKMTAKRRDKIKKIAESLPLPEVEGGDEGDVLLVGWGSTSGPLREAGMRARDTGMKVSSMVMRHVHPLPNGLDEIFSNFKQVLVVEMNDEGIYGYGQLATLLRARYADPRIQSITKTDGLAFRIREILAGIDQMMNKA